MAGLDVDTSSYVKPPALPAQKSVLDQVGQFQQIESSGITISKQKLDLLNDQFKIMNSELSTLADPEANGGRGYTKQEAAQRLTTIAKTLGFKPEVSNHMMQELNTAKDVPSFARNAMLRGQSEVARVNNIYGTPGTISNGQTVTPVITSPMLNGGVPIQRGMPIQQQIPPTAPTVDPKTNQPTMQGPTPAVLPPGTAAGPQRLPVGPGPNFRSGVSSDTPNNVVSERNPYPAPSGPVTGQSPLFAQGLSEYTKDQSEASARASSIKNLTQALPLINSKGFLSGPGTEAFTKGVSALKTWGIVPTETSDDPTAIRQEVNKKLANYISNSPIGQRSDAAQTLKEAASPSAKVQILPALKTLVRDAIGLERIQIAMPNAFKGKDYDNYIKHKGTFPQSVDERAFVLDQDDSEKSQKLIADMAKKEKSANARDRNEAAKFFKSLRIADEQGFYQ